MPFIWLEKKYYFFFLTYIFIEYVVVYLVEYANSIWISASVINKLRNLVFLDCFVTCLVQEKNLN